MAIKRNFESNTVNENTQSLSDYLPGGRLFIAKNIDGSTLRKLLYGLCGEITRTQNKIKELSDEYYITNTTNLIEEWENALEIPDECLSNTGTLAERRINVRAKLALMNVNTAADFIYLASVFGITIEIIPGEESSDFFPLTFPFTFFADEKHARFTMIVIFKGIPEPTNVFPLSFPITFQEGSESELRCIILKLRPANVHVIYRYEP